MGWVFSGLLAQVEVIHALALRETRTRFGKNRLGYVWAFIEPSLWILTFYVLFTTVQKQPPRGMDVSTFIATGLIPYDLFNKTTQQVSNSINGNRSLLFYPQVRPLDIVFARLGLEITTLVTVFVVIMGGHALAVSPPQIDDPLMVALGFLFCALLGCFLGLIFCALGELSSTVDRIKGPLMRPLFWISGLFFSVNALPLKLQEIVLVNPIVHCVELVRGGWFRSYDAQHADPIYVLTWIIGLAFAGLTLERSIRRKIQVT